MESLSDCKSNAAVLSAAATAATSAANGGSTSPSSGQSFLGNGVGEYDSNRDGRVMLLHVSRPLVGGVATAPDENEALSIGAVKSMTAVLKSFPELENVFRSMDGIAAEVYRHSY